jgi:hypothetical protein
MANETYSENLLRVLIGFFHYSVSQQIAIAHYGKPFHNLTDEEKTKMQNQMILDVMAIARQVDVETVKKFLAPPPPPPAVH